MPISYMDLLKTRFDNISSSEAAAILGITPSAVSRLVREGKIPGVKIGRVYLIPRIGVHEYAKGHEPRRGRPRKKRRYTRRSKAPFRPDRKQGERSATTIPELQPPALSQGGGQNAPEQMLATAVPISRQ